MHKRNKSFFNTKSFADNISRRVGIIILILMILATVLNVTIGFVNQKKITNEMLRYNAYDNALKIQTNYENFRDSVEPFQLIMDEHYVFGTETGDDIRSRASGKKISKESYLTESKIITNLQGLMKGNPEICGTGVLLEKGAFEQGRDYACYITGEGDIIAPGKDIYENKEYYLEAKEGRSSFSKPYKDALTGEYVITVAFPLTDGSDAFRGVIACDMDPSIFSLKKFKKPGGFSTIFREVENEDGLVIFAENKKHEGKNMKALLDAKAYEEFKTKSAKGKEFKIKHRDPDSGKEQISYFLPVDINGKIWWSRMGVNLQDVYSEIVFSTVINIVISFAVILLLILFVRRLLKREIRPVTDIKNALIDLDEGNLDTRIAFDENRSDEIAIVSEKYNHSMARLQAIINSIQGKLYLIKNQDYTVVNDEVELFAGDYSLILEDFREIVEAENRIIREVKTVAEQVGLEAGEFSLSSKSLSEGAISQAASIEELNANMIEFKGQAEDNAKKAIIAKEFSDSTSEEISYGNEKMAETSKSMQGITEKAEEIRKIIGDVDEIAFQTNILALNAAIEAARAGEAGKGFAVVADEVGNLAAKSQEAAQNIADLIENAIEAVHVGDRNLEDTKAALDKVYIGAKNVSERIDEIAVKSEQQMNGVREMSKGLEQISTVVQANSATSEESAASSEELNMQASTLVELLGNIKLKD